MKLSNFLNIYFIPDCSRSCPLINWLGSLSSLSLSLSLSQLPSHTDASRMALLSVTVACALLRILLARPHLGLLLPLFVAIVYFVRCLSVGRNNESERAHRHQQQQRERSKDTSQRERERQRTQKQKKKGRAKLHHQTRTAGPESRRRLSSAQAAAAAAEQEQQQRFRLQL